MNWIVYLVTNLLNDMIYVGVHRQDKNPYDFDGYLGSGRYIKFAVGKYGKENFIRKTLFVYDNHEDAFAKEAEIVNDEFVLREDTYNTVNGGSTPILCGEKNGFYGKKHTQETLDKIQKTKFEHYGPEGYKPPKEVIERRMETQRKYFASEESKKTREKLSIAATGRIKSPETRKKISIAHTGKIISDETRLKLSNTKLDQWKNDQEFINSMMKMLSDPQRCENVSKGLTGLKKTPEHVAKINKNPEKIRKTAEKHRGMKRSDETKQNMSKARKGKEATNKGMRYVHNESGEILMIPKQSINPDGFSNGYGSRKSRTDR